MMICQLCTIDLQMYGKLSNILLKNFELRASYRKVLDLVSQEVQGTCHRTRTNRLRESVIIEGPRSGLPATSVLFAYVKVMGSPAKMSSA